MTPTLAQFHAHLEDLVKRNDGDWRQFKFPNGSVLKDRILENKIDARGALFNSLQIKDCVFKESVDISDGGSAGTVEIIGGAFEKGLTAKKFNFGGDFWWSSKVSSVFDFSRSVFVARAQFYGVINSNAVFGGCSFGDVARFSGHLAYSMGSGDNSVSPERLFNEGASFQGVDFKRPESVRFAHVDLSKAIMADANLESVSFVGIRWPMIGLRRALYDEIWANEHDQPTEQTLPSLEATYRNIRIGIENAKDFNTASDFYFGEMEARRKQLPGWRASVFSIPAMYRFLSGYGCSPGRAFIVLILIIAAYGSLYGFAAYGLGSDAPDWIQVKNTVQYSLSIIPGVHNGALDTKYGHVAGLIVLFFPIIALIQTALFVLSLRGRIKRG